MKHREKFCVKFVEGFSGLFLHQYHLALWSFEHKMFFLMIPPEIFSKEVKKPSLQLKLFLTKR